MIRKGLVALQLEGVGRLLVGSHGAERAEGHETATIGGLGGREVITEEEMLLRRSNKE
jgi:hypothetical protein